MYTFPNIPDHLSKEAVFDYLKNRNITYESIEQGPDNTHIFTHKTWNMISYIITIKETIPDYIFVSLNDIKSNYAIPTAHKKFINHLLK